MKSVICIAVVILLSVMIGNQAHAEDEFATYTVHKTDNPMLVDGVFDEPEWGAVENSRYFTKYTDGSEAVWDTCMKLLWDDEYLYVAMNMSDADVWGTMTAHDDRLYEEEVAEIFLDPDGDGAQYIELEISPLRTVMDLVMSKEYAEGGKSDWAWTLDGFKVGVTADGTINDDSDTDVCWRMECAIPFEEVVFSALSMNWPPQDGDIWRANFYRYERVRDGVTPAELTAWNPTGIGRGFHAPDKFGVLVFDTTPAIPTSVAETAVPQAVRIIANTPNPFNPSTAISFEVAGEAPVYMDVYTIHGQLVKRLIEGDVMGVGSHVCVWDGRGDDGADAASGVYVARMRSRTFETSHRMTLMR